MVKYSLLGQTASTNCMNIFSLYSMYRFTAISTGLRAHFGVMILMTAPAAPFSCAASHTNPVSFRVHRPSASGPFISHGQPPGHPSAPGSGASGGADLSLQEACPQRRWGWELGCGLDHCRHLLPGWVHFSHSSLFPRCQAELHDSGC